MAVLEISLLGTVDVTHEGQSVAGRSYAKVLGLLAYLAVESDRPHQRASLADLLWPEQPEERARHSLRQALSTLRRMVRDETEKSPHILITRDTIAFNRDSDYILDVQAFNRLLSNCDRHDHLQLNRCQPCIRRLEQVVALYRGEFLAGFAPGDSVGFEDWSQMHRQRILQRALGSLAVISAYYEDREAIELALPAVQRQLELEPWQEAAHRQLMKLLWKSGRRNDALAQYERCRQLLAEELGVEPDHETTELYSRIRSAGPPPRNGVAASGKAIDLYQLPVPATRLVGRKQELDEIADLLAHRDCRMLTLIGPGGSGKTRLAIQVASDGAESYPEGARFVSLASVRERDGIAPAIATELGLTLAGDGDPEQPLLDWLRDRSMLLVLDNAEHLADGMRLISRMQAARGMKFLVTSRERLQLHGEWVYEVGGLTVPTLDAIDREERGGAVELFAERLRQVRPRIPLRDEERASVGQICRLVEGMPLAIELAAAWAQSLPLEQIAVEIRRNLDFLSTSMRDVPDRHRSIRAVFQQTWAMLTAEEQAAYRRLSVFRDGFLLPAAEAVAGTSAPLLAALVGKSLVIQQSTGRYRLHELLRHYGEELLGHDEHERQELQHRHSAYFLAFLADRQRAPMGRTQQRALTEIDQDIENIRSAWRWGIRQKMVQALGSAAHALWLFYVVRGWMREGATAFGRLVIALEQRTDMRPHPSPDETRLTLAKAWVRYGGFRSGLGRYDHAISLLSRGIVVLREHDAHRELGLALNMLAAVYRITGTDEEARKLLQESLVEFRTVGDAWGIAFSSNDLGLVSHLLGDKAEAARSCEESRVVFRRIGDRRGQAFAAFNLGVIASRDADYDRARRLHREALTLREETDDRWGMAASLVQLGFVARSVGAWHDARILLLKALDIAWNSSVTPEVLEALVEYAALRIDEGDLEQARDILVAVVMHPANQGQIADRVNVMLHEDESRGSPQVPAASVNGWAVQAVNDLARGLVG